MACGLNVAGAMACRGHGQCNKHCAFASVVDPGFVRRKCSAWRIRRLGHPQDGNQHQSPLEQRRSLMVACMGGLCRLTRLESHQ